MAMYERIKLMEERIPMNPRPPSSASRAEPQRESLDEGRLDLLEHLISTVLQGKSTYLQAMLQHEEILDVLDLPDNKGFTALHIASERVDASAIRILLLAGANPNVLDRFSRSSLHWVVSGGCHCDVCNTERGTCASLLLGAKAHVDQEDLKGETPLAYAARNRFHKAGLVILEHGADMSRLSNGVKMSHLIVKKIPDVMTELLDASITYDEEDNSKLKLDFGVFLDSTYTGGVSEKSKDVVDGEIKYRSGPDRETELLCAMLSAHHVAREELLTHPLTEAFLHLKWTYVRNWFWFLRFFYSSLTLFYTYFVFNLYLVTCPYSPDITKESPKCSPSFEQFILAICIGTCILLMLLGELYEACRSTRSYIRSGTNLGWWLLAITIVLTILPAFGIPLMDWQHTLASISLFYAWVMNLAHISRIPYFGTYVEMLGKVLRKVIIVAFTYFSLFAAFILGFCVMFPKSEFFNSIPKSMFKVFMMMIGDRDYVGVLKDPQETRLYSLDYEIPAHLFYVVFLVVIGIVLMNLLMALAVSDIQELERRAELSLVVKEIREMSLLESFLASKLFLRCLTNCFLSRISVRSRNGRYFRFSATEPEDKSLPSELKRKFIPYLHTRSCLKKRGLGRNLNTPNGFNSRLNSRSPVRGGLTSHLNHADTLEDILTDLKGRLEGLQRRNLQH